MPADPASNLVPAVRGEPGPALRHGAYSLLKLAPRASQLREELAERLPMRPSPADEPTLDLLAMTLAQLERALLVLGAVQADESEAIRDGRRVPKETASTLQRLSADARGWMGRAQRLMDDLGLSPRSRLSLGMQVVQTQSALEALEEHLQRKRDGDG
jgi:hypothetical protein